MQKITSPFKRELFLSLAIVIVLTIFTLPTGLLMPKSTEMFLLVIFALMFFIYLGLIWNEHANDEREHAHQLTAGRVSFFSGTTILCIGIILQAMTHNIDPWLVITLGIMILTKILIRIYTQITQ